MEIAPTLLKSDLRPGQIVESRRSIYQAMVLGDPKRRGRLAKAPRGKVAVRALLPEFDKTYWSTKNIVPSGQGGYTEHRRKHRY